MITSPLIHELHAAYCRTSGQQIEINMARENDWLVWHSFRAGQRFTVSDLVTVITWLQKEIRAGNRNPGALKFRNLIGQPDYFEEDLAQARAALRVPARRPAELESRGPAPAQPPRKADEILASPAFKQFCDLKKQL